MARPRCCGRWCFWLRPYGPWSCTSCWRHFDGPMPKNAEAFFWEAIDQAVASMPPADEQLLALFTGGR